MSFTPVLAPMPRGILATTHRAARRGRHHRGAARGAARGVRRRAVRHRPARPAVAADRRHARRQRRAPAGRGRPALGPRGRRVGHRQPRQGRGRPGRCRTPTSRSASTRPPASPRSESRRERHRRRRASAPQASPPGSSPPARRTSRSSSTTARSLAAAGVFTRNRVKAAPVLWSQQVLTAGVVRAVALNSGGANACTGPDGFLDTHRTAEHVGALLGIGAGDVAVCSTGLIGVRLPTDRLFAGARRGARRALGRRRRRRRHGDHDDRLGAQDGAGARATASPSAAWPRARACSRRRWPRCSWSSPPTPSPTPPRSTRRCAPRPASRSTGSTATAARPPTTPCCCSRSGASGVDAVVRRPRRAPSPRCAPTLARQLVADAEGASKDIRIDVVNAATEDDAVDAARAVSRANLVKCAIHGEDPNWGRILAELGMTDARVRARRGRRRHQRRLGLPRRRDGRRPRPRRHERPRGGHHRRPARRRRRRRPSGPTTSRPAYVHENSAYSS